MTVREEEKAFLRIIAANPAADAPRLVYADWLEEHGGQPERAEFIRLRVSLASGIDFGTGEPLEKPEYSLSNLQGYDFVTGLPLDKTIWQQYYDRANFIEFGHREEWEAHIRSAINCTGITFDRGLPDGVSISRNNTFHDLRRFLTEDTCTITKINISHGGNLELLIDLLQWPELSRIRELSLYGTHIGIQGAISLANSPYLGQLEVLDLNRCRLGDVGFEAIATRMTLPSLRSLCVSDNGITDRGLAPLLTRQMDRPVDPPLLSQLTCLDLACNQIGDVGVAALAASPHAQGLRELNLNGNPAGISIDVARAVADSPYLRPEVKVQTLRFQYPFLANLVQPGSVEPFQHRNGGR